MSHQGLGKHKSYYLKASSSSMCDCLERFLSARRIWTLLFCIRDWSKGYGAWIALLRCDYWWFLMSGIKWNGSGQRILLQGGAMCHTGKATIKLLLERISGPCYLSRRWFQLSSEILWFLPLNMKYKPFANSSAKISKMKFEIWL